KVRPPTAGGSVAMDALPERGRRRGKPYHRAHPRQLLAISRSQYNPTAGRQDGEVQPGVRGQHFAFNPAKLRLAVLGKDLGNRTPGRLFNPLIQIDPLPAQLLGQQLGDGGFAGAAVSDQGQVHVRYRVKKVKTVVEGRLVLGWAPILNVPPYAREGAHSGVCHPIAGCRPYGLGRSGKIAAEVTAAGRAKFSLKLAFGRQPRPSFDRVASVTLLMARFPGPQFCSRTQAIAKSKFTSCFPTVPVGAETTRHLACFHKQSSGLRSAARLPGCASRS